MKLAALCLWAAVGWAQIPGPAGVVEGEIVNRTTGAAVAGARVRVNALPAEQRLAATDAAGRFRFERVPLMGVPLQIDAPGYLRRSAFLSSPNGSDLTGLRLRLIPEATISGKVEDEDGWPVRGAQVSVLAYLPSRDDRPLTVVRSVETNDLGEYRVAKLEPGRYFLRIDPGFALSRSDQRYTPAYYPEAPSESARGIRLDAGEAHASADVRLRRGNGFLVRGRVVWPAGHRARTEGELVQVRSDPHGIYLTRAANIATDGSFTLKHVPPGAYTLNVESGRVSLAAPPQLAARRRIEVKDADLTGVVLEPAPPGDVSGVVETDGRAPSAPVTVTLQPVANNTMTVACDEQGRFVFHGVAPGRYSVRAGGPGLAQKRARLGDADVTNREFEIETASAPLRLTLAPLSTRVAGAIVDAGGAPASDAVAMFHAEAGGATVLAHADARGNFRILFPAAGRYRVVVVEDAAFLNAVDDPELRKRYGRELPAVTIADGANPPLRLVLP